MSIEGITLAQLISNKPMHLVLGALLGLCFAGRATAQLVVVTRPSDGFLRAGGRLPYLRNPVIVGVIGGGISSTTYVGFTAIVPPPSPVTTVFVPSSRLTINNYYGGPVPILGPGYGDDVRGIDLDLVPRKKPEPLKLPEPDQKPPTQETSKQLPGVEVSKSRPSVRPPAESPPPPPPPLPGPPEPLADPLAESWRQIDLGLAKFQAGDYGLAAQRFRQATELSPKKSQTFFLLSQAEFAMGNYRQAVSAIHAGMNIDKQWPLLAVKPRLDLYGGRDVEYTDHMKRLTDSLAALPSEPTVMFLVAHQLWFDGQRGAALALLQRARPLTNDPVFIDAFLAAGGVGKLAAN